MNKAIELIDLQTELVRQETILSKLERQYEAAVRDGSTERHRILIDYGQNYVTFLMYRDQIAQIESELEYAALPFWKKLFR